jgi:phosphohistidine phosphatase
MKILMVLRHGHAEQLYKETDKDYFRNLDERGRAEVKKSSLLAKSIFKGNGKILSSSAARTRQTTELFALELGCTRVEFLDNLYNGDVKNWWEAIEGVEEEYSTLVLVGHNPTLSDLCTQIGNAEVSLNTGELFVFMSETTWLGAANAIWQIQVLN